MIRVSISVQSTEHKAITFITQRRMRRPFAWVSKMITSFTLNVFPSTSWSSPQTFILDDVEEIIVTLDQFRSQEE